MKDLSTIPGNILPTGSAKVVPPELNHNLSLNYEHPPWPWPWPSMWLGPAWHPTTSRLPLSLPLSLEVETLAEPSTRFHITWNKTTLQIWFSLWSRPLMLTSAYLSLPQLTSAYLIPPILFFYRFPLVSIFDLSASDFLASAFFILLSSSIFIFSYMQF